MTTRLLAVVLALFIGSPVCWCCITHAEPAVQVEESDAPACPMCAKKEASEHPGSDAPAKKKSCACQNACSAREITQPTLAVPAAIQTDLPPVVWVWEDSAFYAARHVAASSEYLVHETGPPRPVEALYLRYCALLN